MLYYKINEELKLTSDSELKSPKELKFNGLASTNHKSPGGRHRENLPVFVDENGTQWIPEDEIHSNLLGLLKKQGTWNVFLRNRAEILRTFTMMMKHDPDCLILRSLNRTS